jgi:deoxycytidylate deaminase
MIGRLSNGHFKGRLRSASCRPWRRIADPHCGKNTFGFLSRRSYGEAGFRRSGGLSYESEMPSVLRFKRRKFKRATLVVSANSAAERRPKGGISELDARGIIRSRAAHELFFAVVGPVGAGSSHVARQLERCLADSKLRGVPFTCTTVKASDAIRASYGSREASEAALDRLSPLERKVAMQERGDSLRLNDHAAIAAHAVGGIAAARAKAQGRAFEPGEPVEPDGNPRAYIIDSLKHPAEVKLLRRLYGEAFVLIGVVCSPPVLKERLADALFNRVDRHRPTNISALEDFIRRDADDPDNKHGQHVTDAFHEADFFIDNTPEVETPPSGDFKEAVDARLIGELSRLVSIILHDRIHRPSVEESAMHAAYSAQLQSSCLSRQVGAALIDDRGNIVATGTNEVPKAGGGVYGEDAGVSRIENRCAMCNNGVDGPYCSNNRQQNLLFEDAVKALFGKDIEASDLREKLVAVRKTQLGGLLEFSRSVHAEMDALLSAGRSGTSTVGSRLFVTTYPCHYCARHIVSAGVYEVQYIEPYPKSRAIELHGDAIETVAERWTPPTRLPLHEQVTAQRLLADRSNGHGVGQVGAAVQTSIDVGQAPASSGKVLFRPFVGVAPRLYAKVFRKDREYKDKITGAFAMGDADWGNSWSQHQVSYANLESQVTRNRPQDGG